MTRSTRIPLNICSAIAPHAGGAECVPRGSLSGSAALVLHTQRGAGALKICSPRALRNHSHVCVAMCFSRHWRLWPLAKFDVDCSYVVKAPITNSVTIRPTKLCHKSGLANGDGFAMVVLWICIGLKSVCLGSAMVLPWLCPSFALVLHCQPTHPPAHPIHQPIPTHLTNPHQPAHPIILV